MFINIACEFKQIFRLTTIAGVRSSFINLLTGPLAVSLSTESTENVFLDGMNLHKEKHLLNYIY